MRNGRPLLSHKSACSQLASYQGLFGKPFRVLHGRNTEHVRSGKQLLRREPKAIFLKRRPWKAPPVGSRLLDGCHTLGYQQSPLSQHATLSHGSHGPASIALLRPARCGRFGPFYSSPSGLQHSLPWRSRRCSTASRESKLYCGDFSGFLHRAWSWYLAAIVLPSSSVFVATLLARSLHQGAPLIAMETLLPTMVIQVGTGALGEELGWRGFLLPILQRKASPVISALIMSVLWSLWHSPSFFFPGLPQVFISPLAFLATVTAFGVFLSLIFNKTRGHVFGTILAHFVLNTSLALGGARFGNVLWWSLAGTFSLLACWSGFMLSRLRAERRKTSSSADE
jgi:membrane protease YdiL (CAAX protease family)